MSDMHAVQPPSSLPIIQFPSPHQYGSWVVVILCIAQETRSWSPQLGDTYEFCIILWIITDLFLYRQGETDNYWLMYPKKPHPSVSEHSASQCTGIFIPYPIG